MKHEFIDLRTECNCYNKEHDCCVAGVTDKDNSLATISPCNPKLCYKHQKLIRKHYSELAEAQVSAIKEVIERYAGSTKPLLILPPACLKNSGKMISEIAAILEWE